MTALRRLPILLTLLMAAALLAPAGAAAAPQTFTYTKQISVSGYEVRQGISPGIENPDISTSRRWRSTSSTLRQAAIPFRSAA
jgi:uncharacterized protein involved in exopolysaccharide biosynthesis